MNKADLITAIAAEAEVTKKDAEKVLKALTNAITAELKKADGKIVLPEIGSFKVSKRAARKVRNPRTNETIMSKACFVPKFAAAKALKDAVNK